MKKNEVLIRLCKLQAEVQSHIGYEHAADCFCGHGGFWSTSGYTKDDYRNDGAVLEFIERATRAYITAEQHGDQT